MCSLDGSLAVALACSLSLIGSFSRSWVCRLVPCFGSLLCYGAFALPRCRTCVFPLSLVGSFSRSLVCSSRSCVSLSHLRVLSQLHVAVALACSLAVRFLCFPFSQFCCSSQSHLRVLSQFGCFALPPLLCHARRER